MFNGDGLKFLRAVIRSPGRVGAFTPSSPVLARRMAQDVDEGDDGAVLELGPGTGPITRMLRERLADPAAYLGVEREPTFVRLLNDRFPDLRFVEGLAEEADAHLLAAGMQRVRAIISSLPFASLDGCTQDAVIACVARLMGPGCFFRTYQYLHAWPLPAAVRFRRRVRDVLGPFEIERVVLQNLPPAVVLCWRR